VALGAGLEAGPAAGIGAAKTVCEIIRLFPDQAYIGVPRRGNHAGHSSSDGEPKRHSGKKDILRYNSLIAE
jgi:hypothetical protein